MAKLAERSDKEGWPAARFLAALLEHETADRGRRRIARHLAEARLPVGKTLDAFDFEAVPMVSKAQVMALTSGDSWPFFNNAKGYGFIRPDAGGHDVFVHASAVEASAIEAIGEGDRVSFVLEDDQRSGKKRAAQLQKA